MKYFFRNIPDATLHCFYTMSNIETSSTKSSLKKKLLAFFTRKETSTSTSSTVSGGFDFTLDLPRPMVATTITYWRNAYDPYGYPTYDPQRMGGHFGYSQHRMLYNAFGPNWEYHLMEEMNERRRIKIVESNLSPESKAASIAFLDFENDQNALWNSQDAKRILSDLVNGINIVNPHTLSALHSWSPQVKIRFFLDKFPEWKVFSDQIDRGAIVARLGKTSAGGGFSVKIQQISRSERLELWQNAVNKLFETQGKVCSKCKPDDHSAPLPGQIDQITFHGERVPFRCEKCRRIGAFQMLY